MTWIKATDRLPVVGQLIVARWLSRGTIWAGAYIGRKQTFDEWFALPQ